MLKKPKNKQKTVAEKVAETILKTNDSDSSNDSADEATVAKVIECDDDEYELPHAGTTEFRKRNVKLLSEQHEKYKGKIVSRKDLESDSRDEREVYENSDSSENEESLAVFNNTLKRNQNKHQGETANSDEEEIETDEEGIETDEEEEENDEEDGELDSEDENEENQVVSTVNHEAEVQKGLCVQNQLRIWERLLELRINLQKLLNKTNSLPSPHELKNLEENNNKYKDIKETSCKQTYVLLQNLLSLKNNLTSQFPEMQKAIKTSLKRPSPFNEQTLAEPPLKRVGQYLEEGFIQFRSYRNEVLLKWDDRTKLLQPGAGSKKKTFNEDYDIVNKIENALVNKSLLVEKSQQLKNFKQSESTVENILNRNMYDDSDFYHQQLRELIEYKANTTSNMSEVTKQFLELQKLRQKMKKKVDTKASKGRKLRYVVHNKLINFMAPNDNSTWTMESVDELSKSLFV